MDEIFGSFAVGMRLAAFFGISGGIFALGAFGVCKALNWAPVNLTVNIHNHHHRED